MLVTAVLSLRISNTTAGSVTRFARGGIGVQTTNAAG
jgi:hypothetical protein